GGGRGGGAAGTAIVAQVGYVRVVDHRLGVDVVNRGRAEIVDGAVIAEDAVLPVAALIADAHITEAVIDAAVKPDMRPPIASMPDIRATAPAPVPRRPEHADDGRLHPGARHPLPPLSAPAPSARTGRGPIPRRPEASRGGARWVGTGPRRRRGAARSPGDGSLRTPEGRKGK